MIHVERACLLAPMDAAVGHCLDINDCHTFYNLAECGATPTLLCIWRCPWNSTCGLAIAFARSFCLFEMDYNIYVPAAAA